MGDLTILFFCEVCGGGVDTDDVEDEFEYDRDGPFCPDCRPKIDRLGRDPSETGPEALAAGRRIVALEPSTSLGQCTVAEHAAAITAALHHAVLAIRRRDPDALRRPGMWRDYWRGVTAPRPHPWPSVWDERAFAWVAG